MGGGDLNMKKSWHPLLMKNQERVWLEEKKALEEKKKLDQLRKELEEERQLQELQRLQEAQTGKKKVEKLEWMYATPASGGGPSANELEDYLLGKKRVDQMLKGDESAKVGASHKNFIAVQNANTIRDTAAKIREDPMFAIKQQEQAEYASLMSNPLRLRALKERAGIVDEKDKAKDKEERKRLKKEKKRERRHRDEQDGILGDTTITIAITMNADIAIEGTIVPDPPIALPVVPPDTMTPRLAVLAVTLRPDITVRMIPLPAKVVGQGQGRLPGPLGNLQAATRTNDHPGLDPTAVPVPRPGTGSALLVHHRAIVLHRRVVALHLPSAGLALRLAAHHNLALLT
ncbi:RNA-splicing factor, partial [Ceratobasidium sp. 423]